jgi:nitroimidazol reductase NimA-like FMN-containing flavoprotein (pyridoxamine 5'-phosphate oxidase superfamily)
MNKIPDKYRDLHDRPIVVSLATLMSDGQPQAQPVWCSFDGTHILVNTEKGRQKHRNMSRRPAVTILAIDPTTTAAGWKCAAPWSARPKRAPTSTSMS